MKKRFGYITLAIVGYLLLGHAYYAVTGGFSTDQLLRVEAHPELSRASFPYNDFDEKKIFSYLDQGHQTFAFENEDRTLVLKLFKKDYLKRTPLLHVFPPIFPFRSWLHYEGERKEFRRKRLIEGYQAAYYFDRDNSGLVAFNSMAATCQATLKVPFQHSKTINLCDYYFALQEQGTMTKTVFLELIRENNLETLKERIKELFALIFSSYRNGIIDEDNNILENTGFIGSKAIRFDVGKVRHIPSGVDSSMIEEQLDKIRNNRLEPWFKKHAPEHTEKLLQTVDKAIADESQLFYQTLTSR